MAEKKEINIEDKIKIEDTNSNKAETKQSKKHKHSLKEILYETYKDISNAVSQNIFIAASTGASAYALFGYPDTVKGKIIQKLTENPGYISDFVQNGLNTSFGYYSFATVALTAAFYASKSIAKNYDPVGKISGITKKLAYNKGKFLWGCTRDFVGGIVSPFSKGLGAYITTKETYISRINNDLEVMQSSRNKAKKKAKGSQNKINKLQKLKTNYLQTEINKVQEPKVDDLQLKAYDLQDEIKKLQLEKLGIQGSIGKDIKSYNKEIEGINNTLKRDTNQLEVYNRQIAAYCEKIKPLQPATA